MTFGKHQNPAEAPHATSLCSHTPSSSVLAGPVQIAAGDPPEDRGGSGRTPCGRVVGIIKRNWRTRGYAGSLQPPRQGQALRRGAANSSLFCPVERKYPMIRITTRQVPPGALFRLRITVHAM